jgi:hypothetical protein
MACCGLCRPKVKSTIKTKKNITIKKLNTINMWIENIESPYEPIILPSKPPDKPNTINNKEEIAEAEINSHLSDISVSSEQDKIIRNDNMKFDRNRKSGRQNLQYLSSDLSISEYVQSTMSRNVPI